MHEGDQNRVEYSFQLEEMQKTMELFGHLDQNLKLIEEKLKVDILVREGELKVIGEEANLDKAKKTIEQLIKMQNEGMTITSQAIIYMIDRFEESKDNEPEAYNEAVTPNARGKMIRCKTMGQSKYIDSIQNNEIVLV